MSKSTFEKNGGYFIDGVPYMDCKVTGEPVRNVSMEAKSVIGSKAVMGKIHKMFPETTKKSACRGLAGSGITPSRMTSYLGDANAAPISIAQHASPH